MRFSNDLSVSGGPGPRFSFRSSATAATPVRRTTAIAASGSRWARRRPTATSIPAVWAPTPPITCRWPSTPRRRKRRSSSTAGPRKENATCWTWSPTTTTCATSCRGRRSCTTSRPSTIRTTIRVWPSTGKATCGSSSAAGGANGPDSSTAAPSRTASTTFELQWQGEITYPQPRWIEGKGFLHLFTKYTNGRELYWSTSPDGRTWAPDQKFAGIEGHYQTSHQIGNLRHHRLQQAPGPQARQTDQPLLHPDRRFRQDLEERRKARR